LDINEYINSFRMEAFMIKNNFLHARLVSTCKIELSWNASDLPIKIVEVYFNQRFSELTQVMRIYDVSQIIFNGLNAHHFFEIAVPFYQGSWTVKGLEQNRSYIVEIGVKFIENKFFPLLRSNCVYTTLEDDQIESKISQHGFTFPTDQERLPAWTKHVSTYSYYKELARLEDKNG
jgi:uncharacterized protein